MNELEASMSWVVVIGIGLLLGVLGDIAVYAVVLLAERER